MKKYDLVIIGAGPGGTPIANEYALMHKNKKVLLIDKKGELGGECLFDGCIPSKILEVSGKYVNTKNKLAELGVIQSDSDINWQTIVQRKKDILAKRTKAAKTQLLSLENVDIIKGLAFFGDKNHIIVKKNDIEIEIQFEKAVVATGSRTFVPPFTGDGVKKAWTNKEFFDTMELPKDITIIGDGPIGIEMSQILSTLGVSVNLIGNRDVILPMIDKRYSDIILDKLKSDKNINLLLNVQVDEINFGDDKFDVIYTNDKKEKQNIKSSKVFIATGRTPNIESLQLEKAEINFEKRGVVVDEYLQTTNKNVYACGDVALHFPQFAHTAMYGAHTIAQNLFFERNKFKVDFDKNSWVLFSNPNFASAGLSEQQAKDKGFDVIVGEYDYSTDAKAQIENEDLGFLKFIVDKKTMRIVGINIIGENIHSIAGESALIVAQKMTLQDLISVIHPHPTMSESYTTLAKMMMGHIMHTKMENPMFKVGFTIKKWT